MLVEQVVNNQNRYLMEVNKVGLDSALERSDQSDECSDAEFKQGFKKP